MRLYPPAVAGAGQFWLLGVSALAYLAFFTYISLRMGRAIRGETDGCLLAISNAMLLVVGGMAGLLIFRFPYNLLSSMVLAFLAPGTLTLSWVLRTLPRKR